MKALPDTTDSRTRWGRSTHQALVDRPRGRWRIEMRLCGLVGLATAVLSTTGCLDAGTEVERASNPLGAECSVPELASTPPVSPPSTAHVDTDISVHGTRAFSTLFGSPTSGACGEGHGDVDFCFNERNPPAPSIERNLSIALDGYEDGVAVGFPGQGAERGSESDPARRPQAGDAQILPYSRTSNDGRLLFDGGWESWPKLSLLRPENVGYDHTVASAAHTPLSPQIGELHALAWFNPADTSFEIDGADPEVWNLIQSGPNVLHSTLCENSSERIDSVARSPYACQAKYGAVPYGRPNQGQTEVTHVGLCYDVTMLTGAVRSKRKSGPSPEHWELRSAPLTLFVRNPYGANAGEAIGDSLPVMWAYPQRVARDAELTEDGVVVLPDFAAYDLGAIFPWDQIGSGDVDLSRLVMGPSFTAQRAGGPVEVPTNCYAAPGQPDASGPPWCAFLWDQRRTSDFYLDMDKNATAETDLGRLTHWDGRGRYALFEAATEGTGRLAVVNFNNGLFYSVQSTDTPCAADGFKVWRPLSLMPVDPAAAAFPLARSSNGQPFRDSSGAVMPFGSLHRFAYQWLDREGKNLITAQMNEQRDAYKPNAIERVFVRAADIGRNNPPASPDSSELERNAQGMASRAGHEIGVIGSWTEGKFVTLDNGLNLSDFGGGNAFGPEGNQYTHRYRLDLYRDRSVSFVPRGVSAIQSNEHVLGLFDALRPTMPFDVVWGVSGSNNRNAEIVFDDYHAKNALVVAHMNAPLTFSYGDDATGFGARAAPPMVLDGFVATGGSQSTTPRYQYNTDKHVPARARLQNAAGHSPVSSLRLRGGARVEPVALGGVMGRGVYLDEHNDFIDMGGYYGTQMPRDYYAGIWVDLRVNEDEDEPDDRVLFYFADDAYIGFVKNGAHWDLTAYAGRRKTIGLGGLIESGVYHHVGVLGYVDGDERVLSVLIDGNRIGELRFPADRFDLRATYAGSSSRLTIGSPYKQKRSFWDWLFGRVGRRGALGAWVDEFRLYALEPGEWGADSYFAEVACNQALGTLVAVEGALPAALAARVAAIDAVTGQAHGRVCEQLQIGSHGDPTDLPRQVGRGAVCVDKVHRNSADPRCLRAQLHRLPTPVAELPRDDERGNAFCLSCHTDPPRAAQGLGLAALTKVDVARWLDPRRQPLNPPATIALPGNICRPDSPLRASWYALFATWSQSPAPHVFATDFVTDGQIPANGGAIPAYLPPFVTSALD